MADESKAKSTEIPTLTDLVAPGRDDTSAAKPNYADAVDAFESYVGEADPYAPTQELPRPGFEIESDPIQPADRESDTLGLRPEILPLDEIEDEMNPLEATEELTRPAPPVEPDALDDDDQRTDEVRALPLQVTAMVDEILARHLNAAREEILRRLAELMDELDNVPDDRYD
jgi:hypothetical protein